MIKDIKNKYNSGFALLFTVVIISVVSVVTAGLTNAIYKQSILSSLARDSQSSFYQADTASECALYADFNKISYTGSTFIEDHLSVPWKCGDILLLSSYVDASSGSYKLLPNFADDEEDNNPCFRIYVDKNEEQSSIKARGYNICNMLNKRTVEREIETIYKSFTE